MKGPVLQSQDGGLDCLVVKKKNTVLAEDPGAISNLHGSLKLFMTPVPGEPTSSFDL